MNKSITYGFDIQNHVFSKTKGKGGSNSNMAIDSLASQCSKKTKTPQSPSSSNSAASSREKITIFYPQEQPVALTFPPLWQEACTSVYCVSDLHPHHAVPSLHFLLPSPRWQCSGVASGASSRALSKQAPIPQQQAFCCLFCLLWQGPLDLSFVYTTSLSNLPPTRLWT